jgi:protein TonB
MKRSTLLSIFVSASALFAASEGTAAEPVITEPMTLDFDRSCTSIATEEELSGPDVFKARLSPKYPPSPPKYPEEAKKRGEQGTVRLLLLVNEDGYVTQAKVLKSSGFLALDRAGLESSGEWRFLPGKVNGKATCMWITFSTGWTL